MQLITEEVIAAMGIQLSEEAMKTLITHANDTLSERVGADIVASLDDEKLEAYVALQTKGDEEISAWLASNVPELKEIVENERDIVLGEIAENADDFTK